MTNEETILKGNLDLADTLLDVVPVLMRSIRMEMRSHRNAELSVPQFRVLNFLHIQGTASLSTIAEHLGQTSPSTSAMVEGLVGRGMVSRELDDSDRRKVVIETTTRGEEAWESAWKATRRAMAQRLESIEPARRGQLSEGLQSLRALFSS